MAKYQNKTVATLASVDDFIQSLPNENTRQDSYTLIDLMEKTSGYKATMWGSAIVGFGTYHYLYDSGSEGDAPLVAFSPRKQAFSLYLSSQFEGREEYLQILGKHKSGKACINVKKLEDIDLKVLKKMITLSIKHTKQKYK